MPEPSPRRTVAAAHARPAGAHHPAIAGQLPVSSDVARRYLDAA